MPNDETDRTIVYRVDNQDRICYVNEAYDRFASENDGAAVRSKAVIGTLLWEHITDLPTQTIYKTLLQRARLQHPISLTLRCDSPSKRRLLTMHITNDTETDETTFSVDPISVQPRDYQRLLKVGRESTDTIIQMCSWCMKLQAGDSWLEVEGLVSDQRLFEQETLPEISHGICPDCRSTWTRQLKRLQHDKA